MVIPWWVEDKDFFVNTSRYGRYMMMWREVVKRALSIKEVVPERYCEVRYEDLAMEPDRELQKIISFLGVDHKVRKAKKARTSSIGIAKENRSSKDLDLAENVAGGLLSHLGYI